MTLREMREAARLTQDAAAALADLSQAAVSTLERGGTPNPSIRVVENLARVYGRPVPDVIAAVHETVAACESAA